jgi:protein gp37
MGETTGISWTDHTFNPWWGCFKVSPGCANCYAETFSNRYGHDVWGPPKTTSRRLFGTAHWNEPLKWNEAAKRDERQHRVFCASMADVFEDHPLVASERNRLWMLIERTNSLDWLLLTKRPENVLRMSPWHHNPDGLIWPTVWLGTSVEDQQRADERIPALLEPEHPVAVRFLSCEPLLGPVDLTPWLDGLDWVIVGGESGPGHRAMNPDWARSLRDQCVGAGVAFFFKQDSGPRSGMRPELDGQTWHQFPTVGELAVAR